MTSQSVKTTVGWHRWEREPNEHYVEPEWCSLRLFQEEDFSPGIWDPCCGFGTIPKAAIKSGLSSIGTDLVDRGYPEFKGELDFTKVERGLSSHIVCNPPFNIAGRFADHALSLPDTQKVAMIFPTARLNAAHWIRNTPLARVWLMTPRPSMPPGHVISSGQKPGGGKMDFCWLVWTKGRIGPPDLRWLRRNGEK